MGFNRIAIYDRISSIEDTIKEEEHQINLLTNSVVRYKDRLEWLERMGVAYENFKPTIWEEWALKLYVESVNLADVAKKLDEMGHRLPSASKSKPERKITTNDISDFIKAEPINEIHECAQRFFEVKNKNNASVHNMISVEEVTNWKLQVLY